MNIEDILVRSETQLARFTADEVIAGIQGTSSGRTSYTASYQTHSTSPTVYYTALNTDSTVLTSRRTGGVVLAAGLYTFVQDVTGVLEFIAVWDEGDALDYTSEWIEVPK